MKKKKDYTLLAIAIPFLFAVLVNLPGCYSLDKKAPSAPLRDYQLITTNDSLYLYDGNRLVGTTEWGNNGIEQMILLDNQ